MIIHCVVTRYRNHDLTYTLRDYNQRCSVKVFIYGPTKFRFSVVFLNIYFFSRLIFMDLNCSALALIQQIFTYTSAEISCCSLGFAPLTIVLALESLRSSTLTSDKNACYRVNGYSKEKHICCN